jgi:integrase
MNEKIDIHLQNNNIESKLNKISDWKIPQTLKKDLKNFIKELSMGKINKGHKISSRTQVKYLTLLKIPLEYFNKDLTKLIIKDIEEFEKEISSGGLKVKRTRKPYSHSMKVDIRRALIVLLNWKLGKEKTDKLTDWLDTRDKKKTPEFLKEAEIIKLFKGCKNNLERFIIAILFDSGARAEEFLNIRYEDIELPEKNQTFPKIHLKEEYSKTEGRTISLYWEYSNEALRDFVNEREKEGVKSKEPIINVTYDSIRFFLGRLGMRVLKKHIHFHLFRHSSATYYASKLNRQQLCYRYGWKFSSDMPDVYISRSGMNNKELDEQMENTELGELKKELTKEQYERKKQQEELERLNKEQKKFSEENIKKLVFELAGSYFKDKEDLKNYVVTFGSSMKEKPKKN